ncbi:hypothetical protein B0H17DRAFT_496110 [Mycena rosella]|uniref:Nephrocystin 3-like N-terminal domain-containing protein n=1 Tax=Mycena rosella TaxID=1033263 RepID=A0AAD7C2T4_MYCRO|nr:hypothetical protein B0H17DRAFT_496110 [Mycena rosella]
MSFFSDASGVNITGGTFYSAARDVNIQNDLQLAMQDTSQTLICVGAPVHGRDGFQTGIEDRPLSGLENNRRYAPDTERLPSHDWSTSPGLPPLDSYPRGGLFPVTSASAHSQTPVRRPYDETGRVSQAHEGPPTSPAHPLSNGLYSVPGNIMNTPPTTICAPPGPHGAGTNIHGGTFVGGNVNNIHRNGETGIGILHRAVALAALHDSAESYPQPRCHPETRKDLLEQLWTWCTDSSVESPILWLHGPAGAGKSAVMVTLSNRLQDAQQLGGTFFFKRGHPTRGNANVLFSTIALQLAVNIPELKLPIARVVEENPSLVARSMNMQLRQLLIEPCLTLEFHPIPTILIDGLDECEGKDIQQNILHLLRDSPTPACLPFRMIIASRPEPHIRELLELSSFRGQYRPFNIEQSYRDVCAYLESEFARIHREHSTLAATPYPWPAPEVIDRLVEKSSGYFIYASTIIKFIDDKHYRPTRRLAAIEGLSGVHSPSPFAALDALYRQILLEIPENPDLVPILRVIHHFHLRPDQIEELLGLESGDVQLALRGLYSVIDSTASHPFLNSGPGFIHASFADFLQDPLRAGDFCTSDAVGLNDLARLILSEFAYKHEHPEKNQTYPLALWVYIQFFLRRRLKLFAARWGTN